MFVTVFVHNDIPVKACYSYAYFGGVMKTRLIFVVCIILAVFSCSMPETEILSDPGITVSYDYDVSPDTATPNKRVVVYIPYWSFSYARTNTLDLDKVTHINLAFVNPDSNGDFSFPEVSNTAVASLVSEARAKGVKVLMSIGGAGTTVKYDDWITETNVQALVNRMINCMLTYKLDGIDVDLESDRITSEYNRLIETINNSFPDEDMLLTAAVQKYTGSRISDVSLTYFDFINPMAYDMTGPWNPGGQHSSYAYAVENLEYWNINRGVQADKICLGVPFYGYDFAINNGQYISYRNIIAANQSVLSQTDVSGETFYNGIPTIQRKTTLAQSYGGIMVWEISQDADAPYSLLDAIYNQMHPAAP